MRFAVLLVLSSAMRFLAAAPLTVPVPGLGTFAANPGANGGTFSYAVPGNTAAFGANGPTLSFNGIIPKFSGMAVESPGAQGFTGTGPIGTFVAGASQGPGGLGASVTGIATFKPLSGYDAGGAVHVGPDGISATFVATNAHSSINGGLVAAPTSRGGGVTAKVPGATARP